MNKWIKILSILVIIGILAAFAGYKFIYNKPHKDYEKAEADFKIDSKALFSAFTTNRVESEQKFNGKVLEISGKISSIEEIDSLVILVFAIQEGMFGDEGIRCTMLSKFNEKTVGLVAGSQVRIKGYCTGYNDTDIIMEKCSISK